MPVPDVAWSTPSRPWASGPWSLQLRHDELADIAFEGRVVLRSIRAVVRDSGWGTAALIVDRVRETDATLALHVRSDGLGSSFRGVVRVEARPGRLDIVCDLESERDFDTNRSGLVVLHPPRLAGVPLHATHPDGRTDETRFPAAISPHQPVLDIASLGWRDDGYDVSVAFDGDVFEMEDQRNWTDASFKTYSRPLALPFPYRVRAGERVRQTVSIRVRPVVAARVDVPPVARITLVPGGPFPAIGVGAATAPDPGPVAVGSIGSALMVELDLNTTNWRAALARASASARPLDVRIVLERGGGIDRSRALGELLDALHGLTVLRLGAFDPLLHVSDATAVDALRVALAGAGIDAPVIGGTRSHFTELNREQHRVPAALDGIAFATTPLFHTTGGEQLVESLGMQRLVALQAVEIAAGRAVFVGPVTLRARFNNVATEPEPAPARADLGEGYGAHLTGADDPRQNSPELAAWTVASAAALAVPGVAALTYFEEWGPRGVRSADGQDRPVAGALRALASLHGGELLWGGSPDGLVWAIGGRAQRGTTVLAANLSEHARSITVEHSEASFAVDVPARAFVLRA